jgi:hypothetical protein
VIERGIFIGRWMLNPALSTFSTPTPRDWTLVISADAAGMSVEEHMIQADGNGVVVHSAPQFDGRDYPVVGSPIMDSLSVTPTDGQTLQVTAKKAQVVTMTDTTKLSLNGEQLTVIYKVFAGEEVIATGIAVFERP